MPPAKELPKGTAAEAPPPPPKKKSRFKLIMLLCSLLLLFTALGGGGYWWLYMRPGAEGLTGLLSVFESTAGSESAAGEGAASSRQSAGKADGASGHGSAAGDGKSGADARPRTAVRPVSLPSLTVNLADSSGTRYLKIGMDVEVNAPEAAQEIDAQAARVRDAIILLLSSKKIQDLATAEGKILLKTEVAGRLNQILGTQRVVRIYFTEFVIR
jgi:flagellar FliL protein